METVFICNVKICQKYVLQSTVMTLAIKLQLLQQEVLEEHLFSDAVDMSQVAAVLATLILCSIERHRLVYDSVLGTVETSATVLHPAMLICSRPYSHAIKLSTQLRAYVFNRLHLHCNYINRR